MGDYLRANFTLRRTIFLLIALMCFGVCTAAVLGTIELGLRAAVAILVVGLLAYEWAG